MAVKYLETLDEFNQALKDAGDKLVVVDFTAAWCGPCRHIAPKYEEMSKEFTNVVFYKVDVDKNAETAEQQGISAMPTFKFYKKGEKIDSAMVMGADEGKLRGNIEENK